MTAPAGWYAEPGSTTEWYWDGARWTTHSRPVDNGAAERISAADRLSAQLGPSPVAARAARTNRPTGRSAALFCPHCQTRGSVQTRRVTQKKGISGGKATGAVLTAGFSLLLYGLSRKEKVTEMRCLNCGTVWYV